MRWTSGRQHRFELKADRTTAVASLAGRSCFVLAAWLCLLDAARRPCQHQSRLMPKPQNELLAMRILLPLVALTLVTLALAAQEEVPRTEAVKVAAALNFDLEKIADTPIPTDADVKRPFGVKAEKRGGLVVPEVKLSPATFSTAGKEAVPVGQLWLAGLVPAKNGEAVSKDQLKLVTVQQEGREVTLPLCVLGVRREAGDKLELLVFGKGKEPVLALPLTKATREQKWPIEFKAEREGDASARVTLLLVGKYEASFLVTEASE
jgi:hypothetical protein